MELREAISDSDYKTGTVLFREYAAGIGVDLEFQDFNREIENIRDQYSRPDGVLFIAYDTDQRPIGCFAIRKLDHATCELKRMYLRKEARGRGLGKQFLNTSVRLGKELGYKKMRLDTLPDMQAAIGLYKKAGFYEIEPYRFNPVPGAIYMEIKLK
ncbi:GNAT family N-acetyltransferase [Sinomicrobium weinanense]|uniref:GNAT family N-acetyltransferase n=1 Tax=Sinomicrobium weinanense TaxID=2842200 RepID=A0A926Q3L6_9FLAO|nr:GNAT family N-acetyltransferase [Sinomicrobium weinanense]MBC9796136.1 GNAT family N-acetyltransferase [Sinomicrobium weinanense]MBU3121887.1 GNAT family N-acetyltransferase [Sinomicrobium weinanense]